MYIWFLFSRYNMYIASTSKVVGCEVLYQYQDVGYVERRVRDWWLFPVNYWLFWCSFECENCNQREVFFHWIQNSRQRNPGNTSFGSRLQAYSFSSLFMLGDYRFPDLFLLTRKHPKIKRVIPPQSCFSWINNWAKCQLSRKWSAVTDVTKHIGKRTHFDINKGWYSILM